MNICDLRLVICNLPFGRGSVAFLISCARWLTVEQQIPPFGRNDKVSGGAANAAVNRCSTQNLFSIGNPDLRR
jgi:hypothetical protein